MSINDKTAVLVELDFCVGCYACQSACQNYKNLPVKETYLRTLLMKPERVDGDLEYFMSPIPLALRHCTECLGEHGEAPCAKICIGKALHIGKLQDVMEYADTTDSRIALFF